jgi:pyruvate dehydrogenase E1 component alpha subunit
MKQPTKKKKVIEQGPASERPSASFAAVAKGIGKEKLRWIYGRMYLIRAFEEKLHEDVSAGRLPGFIHLYAGQEAVAVGVCAHLNLDDYIASTHRGHGHCIAKGVDVRRMKAEIMGREGGCCRGKGGSMHISDTSVGMLGANGVVAAGVPHAVGAALSAKTRGTRQVAVSFVGDGGVNQGVFHESLNLAAMLELPVVFVIENNGYALATPVEYTTKLENLSERARGYGIPGVTVDGTDVFAVYEAAGEAVARARAGGGPTLLECKTCRYYGHFEGDPTAYRSREEEQEYRKRDCLKQFRETVLRAKLLEPAELDKIEQKARTLIEEAGRFAEQSPFPKPETCLDDVFA